MTLPHHLVEDLTGVHPGDTVAIDGPEAHHAVVVRRLAVGEGVVLTDGLGRTATGVVAETAKRSFAVRVDVVHDVPEPQPRITVVQALPKGDRGELAVEMLTEIGVARIVPWAAHRSIAAWKGERATKGHAKWAATAREAAKQSRRSWHPEVVPLARTTEVLDLIAAADLAVVLHEEATAGIADLAVPSDGDLLLVVGPEGGLTTEEVESFVAAGAASCRLGVEVLRTSTAGVAAAAALLSRSPRWS